MIYQESVPRLFSYPLINLCGGEVFYKILTNLSVKHVENLDAVPTTLGGCDHDHPAYKEKNKG